MKASRPFQETKLKALTDTKMAALYLEESLKEGDMDAFKIALQDVAKVKLGMTGLANETELSRETLYTILSEKGNPRLDTLDKILRALGFKLAVQIVKPEKGIKKVISEKPVKTVKPTNTGTKKKVSEKPVKKATRRKAA
jgi:probable addiction module antidote protein